jgi:hypothetical protein
LPEEQVPINKKLMASLVERYGKKKGERVYYAMENEGHPATKQGAIAKAMEG